VSIGVPSCSRGYDLVNMMGADESGFEILYCPTTFQLIRGIKDWLFSE